MILAALPIFTGAIAKLWAPGAETADRRPYGWLESCSYRPPCGGAEAGCRRSGLASIFAPRRRRRPLHRSSTDDLLGAPPVPMPSGGRSPSAAGVRNSPPPTRSGSSAFAVCTSRHPLWALGSSPGRGVAVSQPAPASFPALCGEGINPFAASPDSVRRMVGVKQMRGAYASRSKQPIYGLAQVVRPRHRAGDWIMPGRRNGEDALVEGGRGRGAPALDPCASLARRRFVAGPGGDARSISPA